MVVKARRGMVPQARSDLEEVLSVSTMKTQFSQVQADSIAIYQEANTSGRS